MHSRQSKHFWDADIEHYEQFTGNWLDAKELLGLYEDIVSYYVYLILESKVKTPRKHMKIISECILCFPTLNPEDLDQFIQFKYTNCAQNLSPEFYFSITKNKYIFHIEWLLLTIQIAFIKKNFKYYYIVISHDNWFSYIIISSLLSLRYD